MRWLCWLVHSWAYLWDGRFRRCRRCQRLEERRFTRWGQVDYREIRR